jgi:hypothetical protein
MPAIEGPSLTHHTGVMPANGARRASSGLTRGPSPFGECQDFWVPAYRRHDASVGGYAPAYRRGDGSVVGMFMRYANHFLNLSLSSRTRGSMPQTKAR